LLGLQIFLSGNSILIYRSIFFLLKKSNCFLLNTSIFGYAAGTDVLLGKNLGIFYIFGIIY
jgi:hypothetical protein